MNDPLKTVLMLQQSLLEGWVAQSNHMMQYWQHMLSLQEKLYQQATSIARTHIEIDDGPSFTGKYGKRRFDIDPERDV